ncbi:MAG: signal peptidase II [Planctomycetes bacterium]|nr:signal peptidase II [Planctomycetota bacterium]
MAVTVELSGATKKVRRAVFFSVMVVAAVLDLWSKAYAFEKLGPPGRGPAPIVIPGVLKWETALNKGVAWGMLSQQNARWFIAALSIIALPLIVGCFLRAKVPTWPYTVALAFIGGGTIGNLYDRVATGMVRDFIYVYCINFPVFNVADSFICVGATLFALESLIVGDRNPKKPGPGEPPVAEAAVP